jgi:epothilone synthetase B
LENTMDKLDKNAVAGLSRDQKRELLKQLMAQRAATERADSEGPELALPTIEPDPARRHEPFPLTEIQQAYWVGRKAAFDLGDVSIHFYVELDTRLDIERLQHAWRQVVARHDMLRSVILPNGQQQILTEVPAYEFIREDLRGLDADARAHRLAVLREDMEHDVFPLDRWPSFEIRACRLTDDHYRLYVSIDMVNSDGGSMLLLMREWADFFEEPERPREPLALSYRDYVLAEEALRRTERYQRALAYWTEKIHRLPAAPELPLARGPGEITRTRFVHRTYPLPAEAWRVLQQRIRDAGLSPAVVLLAVYADVLATWSRSQRLSVNVTLFNACPFIPRWTASSATSPR